MLPGTESEPETTGPMDRDERLGEAIEAYLERAEGGSPPDPEAFAKDYPDLGADLVAALEGLALVQGLVGDANGPGHRLEEGRRVAGYRIVRELGRGGMGIVYEAVHVGLDRPVALKVLGTHAAPDSSGRRRFLNEAKTAAGLHHTHIVPVFDVGQVGGLCYYAMQRIEGSGLDRVLRTMRRDRSVAAGSTLGSGSRKTGGATAPRPTPKPSPDAALAASGLAGDTQTWGGLADVGGGSAWGRRKPVDDPPAFTPPRGSAYYRWVAEVGRQAAEALAHAHQRGVIHRDIKPSNLLVDARGVIWVADFGLARRLADPSQTQFDSMLGTPRYMSPEQARTSALDGRADVYSLGATLYELITLRPPFDGQSAAELIEQIKVREPARPRKFDHRVPLDLETILLKALAKRPDDRYATADDLAEDLARFLAHEPVKARRIGPVGRFVRFARRHPSLTAVSTAATVLVLTTAGIAYFRVVNERDRADENARAAKKQQLLTEDANKKLIDKDRVLQATVLTLLEKTAANHLLSEHETNRRSKGLDSLDDAAKMDPDPTTRVKLRDLALAFLSMRDVEARPPIATPDKPQHGLIFGGNGKRITTLSDDGELAVWDVARGEKVDSSHSAVGPSRGRPMNGRGGGGGRDRIGPRIAAAGEQVAVMRPDGGGVRFFDPASPDVPVELMPMKGYHVGGLYASADGRHLLTLDRPFMGNPNRQGPPDRPDQEETKIYLWDRDRPEAPKATLTLPASKLDPSLQRRGMLLAISPDGSKIAAARTLETEVALWDGEGHPLPSIDVQMSATALTLGPAGLLAVAGNGGEIALRNLSFATPKRLPVLSLHQSFVYLIRFSPRNGSLLAAAGPGGGVELWDLSSHTMIAALPTKEGVEDLVFSPDGQTLAAGQPSSIALWSVVEPLGQHMLPETGDAPRGLAFGPSDTLAITSIDGSPVPAPLRLWGGPGRCPPSVEVWDQVRPWSVGFDGQGRLFALEPDALRWYQPPEKDPVAEIELPTMPSMPFARAGGGRPKGDASSPRPPGSIVARTPDGRTLVVNRLNGPPNRLWIWRDDSLKTFTKLDLPERDHIEGAGRGQSAVLDPSGSRLYYLSGRGENLTALTIVGEETGRIAWTAPVPPSANLAISPDGATLAVGERSGTVLLVNSARKLIRERLSPTLDDAVPVDSLAFSPDRRTLAVGAREQVRLWAIDGKPRPLVRLPGHRGSVRSLTFDDDGARLAGADEKTIKVWDLRPLRAELARLGLDW